MAHDPHQSTPHGTTPPAHDGLSPFARLFIYAVIVADLFAVVYFGGTLLLTGSLITPAETPRVVVAGADAPAADAAGGAPAAPAVKFDLASYTADPVKGADVAAKCKACHNFDNGGPNRTGPNLWGIVGAPVEHKADFSYSDGMGANKTKMGTWTAENLFAFLEDPRGVVPGTKMTFAGVKDPKDRADLVAWLKTLK